MSWRRTTNSHHICLVPTHNIKDVGSNMFATSGSSSSDPMSITSASDLNYVCHKVCI